MRINGWTGPTRKRPRRHHVFVCAQKPSFAGERQSAGAHRHRGAGLLKLHRGVQQSSNGKDRDTVGDNPGQPWQQRSCRAARG